MNYIKNTIVGFLISFIGSIPLGYLNIIGLEFYDTYNHLKLSKYLFGVVFIEIIIIYITLLFAQKLVLNYKLKKVISIFTIVFLLILTYIFYTKTSDEIAPLSSPFSNYLLYPFLSGIVLSSINFAQIPFWFSWNLYLINESYIKTSRIHNLYYIIGASLGTFIGMFSLIVSIKKALSYSIKHNFNLYNYIWIVFLVLAIFQLLTLAKEYKKNQH